MIIKKILIISFFTLLLASCSKSADENNSKIVNTNSGITKISTGNTIKAPEIIYLSGITHTKAGYDGFTLTGKVNPIVEKIEISWINSDKKSSFFLSKFKKGDTNFKSNLSLDIGNISYGKNNYSIKGYIGDKVVDKKDYVIDFKKEGCEILLKIKYPTYLGYEKYRGTIRKIKFHMNGDCKDNNIQIGKSESDFSTMINGVEILDLGLVPGFGGHNGYSEDVKEEKIEGKGVVTLLENYSGDIYTDTKGSHIGYSIVSHYNNIKSPGVSFSIKEGITKENMYKKYDDFKDMISSIKELKSERYLFFDYKSINTSSIYINGNTITLTDGNGLTKEIVAKGKGLSNGNTLDHYKEMYFGGGSPSIMIEGNKLYLGFFQGNNYADFIIDIKTGNVMSYEE